MPAKYDTYTTNFLGITVQVDHEAGQPDRGAHFAGLVAFLGGPGDIPGQVRRVHVMSTHAGGEIRSYVLDESRQLRLAGPCYTGEWSEMDAEVARVLGAAVHPYTISPGGHVA